MVDVMYLRKAITTALVYRIDHKQTACIVADKNTPSDGVYLNWDCVPSWIKEK